MHLHMADAWFDTLCRHPIPDVHVYNLGDLALVNTEEKFNELLDPVLSLYWLKETTVNNTLLLGNHDCKKFVKEGVYAKYFSNVVGEAGRKKSKKNVLRIVDDLFGKPQKLVLSHYPQDPSTMEADEINLHGHIHNNVSLDPFHKDTDKYPFLVDGRHFNVSVERLGYCPRTLDEVVTLQARRQFP
jgi:calcineurin-like phosphoesterase family protein